MIIAENMKQSVLSFKIYRRPINKNILLLFFLSFVAQNSSSQFIQQGHRDPMPGEIAITEPGCYGERGKTYILMNNISDDMSTIFLGKDVTLDLNGYTITYASGNYEHIPNYDFEQGRSGWDFSKAPKAEIGDKKTQVMIGENVLTLKEGEEIISEYITLPVAHRSYFAMCGVAAQEMKVSIYVEDNTGKQITCISRYGEKEIISCPGESLSPRLGGGITYAHLNGLPAGKYRLRIKAITDCIIDYADLRPALDVGIGIVEEIEPWVNYTHLYQATHGSFYDYAADDQKTKPLPGIPVVKGSGTVTIKNGTIRNGSEGILSWGIQSNAGEITVILDNIKILTSGINTNAVDVPQAVITRCTFDVNNPFIINRHGSDNYGVDLWGEQPSEVSFSEFFGGQGCLVFKGDFSKIHHNYFVNRQTVTNHYSIMAMGDSSQIFCNRIIPEIGSGIEIYIHRGMQIFNNEIIVQAAPPTCEYGHTDYSTTAIRIADYNAVAGTLRASFGNMIYNNKIRVTGKDYPDFPDYTPMAWALFYSSSGGENFILGNEIYVEDLTPGLKNETAAFYIGGGCNGGDFVDNRITTNVPAFWIANRYGPASNIDISRNLVIKSPSAGPDYKPVRMGWYNAIAKNILFKSNIFEGSEFEIDKTDSDHSYWVSWKATIRVVDKKGIPLADADVVITDINGKEFFRQKTGDDGIIKTDLPEYSVKGKEMTVFSPYTVFTGKKKTTIILNRNKEVVIIK